MGKRRELVTGRRSIVAVWLSLFLVMSGNFACGFGDPDLRDSKITFGSSDLVYDDPPDRDLFSLAQRFMSNRVQDGTSIRNQNVGNESIKEGSLAHFWVVDPTDAYSYEIEGALSVISDHAYWYLDRNVETGLVKEIQQAADGFEDSIRPALVSAFGDLSALSEGGNEHLTVLNTPLRGILGYYSASNEYPRSISPYSNEAQIIYIDPLKSRPGGAKYMSALAHEFQHAVHWSADPGEEAWVNEGMSEMAEDLVTGRISSISHFLINSDVQLNYWPANIEMTGPHYGASALFFTYLAKRFEGNETLRDLVSEPTDGIAGIDVYVSRHGLSFEDVFADWIIANYLDSLDDRYGYPDMFVRVRDQVYITDYGVREEHLPQYSARYIELRLPEGAARLNFVGDQSVPQFGTRCKGGNHCWWSNRGDSIDTRLVRKMRLGESDNPTLTFWVWYDIEKNWDYAYVVASNDNGETWSTLEGSGTTEANPLGLNYGHGYTGSSGGWVKETVDLSRYSGQDILIGFEYVTDEAVYLDGLVIDEIEISPNVFFDDVEQEMDWQAEGFERTRGLLPQHYVVQVMEISDDGVVDIWRVNLDEVNRGWKRIEGFGSKLDRAIVVIAPITRGTHHRGGYSLEFGPTD